MSPAFRLNAAAILSRVLPEWEIEETTHIPIHRENARSASSSHCTSPDRHKAAHQRSSSTNRGVTGTKSSTRNGRTGLKELTIGKGTKKLDV
jgi:hypothetical protein